MENWRIKIFLEKFYDQVIQGKYLTKFLKIRQMHSKYFQGKNTLIKYFIKAAKLHVEWVVFYYYYFKSECDGKSLNDSIFTTF